MLTIIMWMLKQLIMIILSVVIRHEEDNDDDCDYDKRLKSLGVAPLFEMKGRNDRYFRATLSQPGPLFTDKQSFWCFLLVKNLSPFMAMGIMALLLRMMVMMIIAPALKSISGFLILFGKSPGKGNI